MRERETHTEVLTRGYTRRFRERETYKHTDNEKYIDKPNRNTERNTHTHTHIHNNTEKRVQKTETQIHIHTHKKYANILTYILTTKHIHKQRETETQGQKERTDDPFLLRVGFFCLGPGVRDREFSLRGSNG